MTAPTMRFAISLVLFVACGPGSSSPAPTTPSPAEAEAAPAPPAKELIVSPEFDVALDLPLGSGTKVDSRVGSWAVEFTDLAHNDGRMMDFIARAQGGTPLAIARELRDQLATQNECTLPEPVEFLGRDGARFTCVLGDGKGAFYLSSTASCYWSVMITKRGPEEEFEPHVAAMLARISVPSGAAAPNVDFCYGEPTR